ncbi:MAG TPA: hypothetical protein VGF99_09280 [Myxococcota bacterium]
MQRASVLFLVVVGLLSGCDGCGGSPDDGGPGSGEGEGEGSGDGEGEGEGEGDPADVVELRLEPADVTLTTDGLTTPSQVYAVTAVTRGGSERDVSGDVSFALSNTALGGVADHTFTSAGLGGTSEIVAALGDVVVRGTITVLLQTTVVGDGNSNDGGTVPDDGGDIFDDVDSPPVDDARAPQLVYPNDGVLLPRNLGTIEVQWRRGRDDNSLFAVTFKSSVVDIRVITRCVNLEGGCVYSPSPSMWRLLAESHAGAHEDVVVGVVGSDDGGTSIGRSAQVKIAFAATGVQGGLYYWTTSGTTAIMRVDFGDAEQVPEKFFPFQGNSCFGCHALSPDGRKMTLSANGQNDGRLGLINIVDGTETLGFQDGIREQFQGWNGSSSLFAGIFGDTADLGVRNRIRIRDASTANVVETIELDHEPTHPDWSPIEDRLTWTKVTEHRTSQRPGRGAITTSRKIDGAWQAPIDLVEAQTGVNRFTPATAPDGAYVAFVESHCNNPDARIADECDGDADPTGTMFSVAFAGGPPVNLAKANAPGVGDGTQTRLSNSFPKWSPFSEPRFADGEGRIHWMTFSSRRAYGLRTTNPDNGRQLLWMVAVDPAKAAAGEDGSYAAFALPFQDIGTSNHMAQWTREFVEAGCSELNTGCVVGDDDACCGSAVCTPVGNGSLDGTCQPPPDDEDECAVALADCSDKPCCVGAGECLQTSDGAICLSIGG